MDLNFYLANESKRVSKALSDYINEGIKYFARDVLEHFDFENRETNKKHKIDLFFEELDNEYVLKKEDEVSIRTTALTLKSYEYFKVLRFNKWAMDKVDTALRRALYNKTPDFIFKNYQYMIDKEREDLILKLNFISIKE